MAQQEDEQPIGDFLDGLSAAGRKALADAGFDLPRLRALGSTEPGARQVRHIVAEFCVPPGKGAAGRRLARADPGALTDPPAQVAARWALVLLGTAAALAAVIAADVLAGRPLGLVLGGAAWTGLLYLLFSSPATRRREALVLLAAAATAVLLFTAFLNAPQWYLAARGKQVTATVVAPNRTLARGARVAYCRVRLPDGRIEQIDRTDRTCAAADEGARVRVVYDPDGHVDPVLGGRPALGRISRPLAAAVAAVLTATAAAAVAGTRRRRGDR